MIKTKTDKQGFTLIETLIYIALFGLLISGIVVSAYPLITGADRLGQHVLKQGEATFVFHKIGSALSMLPATSLNVSLAGTLTINGGAVSIRQGITTPNSIEISNGGGPYVPLTASRVIFSGFTVIHTAPPGGAINAPHVIAVTFLANGESYSQTYNVFY